MLLQLTQDLLQMRGMFLMRLAGDQHVIEVHEGVLEASQDLIHHPLECLACISQTKGHPEKFEEAKRSDDHSFWDILFCHWYLVITLPQIQLGEDGAMLGQV